MLFELFKNFQDLLRNSKPKTSEKTKYIWLLNPRKKGKSEKKNNTNAYKKICFFVLLIPATIGIIGIFAKKYSSFFKIAKAQKWGGVHKKIIPNNMNGSSDKFPVEQM